MASFTLFDSAMRDIHEFLEPLCSATASSDIGGRRCSGAKMLIVLCVFLLAKLVLPPIAKRASADVNTAFRPFMPPDDAPPPAALDALPPASLDAPSADSGVPTAEASGLRRRP